MLSPMPEAQRNSEVAVLKKLRETQSICTILQKILLFAKLNVKETLKHSNQVIWN